ncbi:hypothetical protein THITH_01555 [Thioalkalivibrio paradoxus ARh 1]|uniref:Uncharacterized protein n=1 Tax=Thioalkalivibrio paradoxus ARh 1 TaxID=713585 RepID=W0DMM2_9GAMM|nr:hypothetical protein THITH_01555 [Thioalkalivibrio paradoxus ARh 1]
MTQQRDLFRGKPARKPRRPGSYRRQEPPRTPRDTAWELPEDFQPAATSKEDQ